MSSRKSIKEQHRLVAEAAERAARERRTRAIRIGVALGLVAIVVVGGIWWQVRSSTVDEVADPGPSVVSESLDDGVALGEGGDDVPLVDIYLDFLCPHCAELEDRIGGAVADMAVDGEAVFVIHPITLIDPTESARSAAAFGCAAGSDRMLGFQRALFANADGGFSADRLVEIAGSVGIDDDAFVQCVRDEAEADWATAVNAEADERGVTGTPTIFVNGTSMDLDATQTAAGFRLEVATLARDAG